MERRKSINKKVLKTNMLFAFTSQGVSFLISILMSLIVPKFLDVVAYGYWQLFIFYVTYIGFFHFGLNDGLYLKLGGVEYGNMDHEEIGSQLKVSVFFQILLGVVIVAVAAMLTTDLDRLYVIIAFAVYMVLGNAASFVGFIFQAANQTKIYSLADIIMKISFIGMLAALLLSHVYDFRFFIVCYIAGMALSVAFYAYCGRSLIFSRFRGLAATAKLIWTNIGVGIKLLFANLAGMLILGIGRLVIDGIWGIEHFGQISFSLSLTNFFLLFMFQVSVVLFPALRQTDEACQKRYFGEIDDFLSILLPVILLCYIPAKELLILWLPQYAQSLDYLAILLPLCLFDGKMQLLCSTYFKVLRKEKMLLYVNLAACLFSLILCCIGGFVLSSVDAIVVFMLLAVALRYVLSEIYLAKVFRRPCIKKLLAELLLISVFVVVSWFLPSLMSFAVVVVLYGVYLAFRREETKKVFSRFVSR